MSCVSCKTGACSTSTSDTPSGCQGACGSGGCNKMNVYDWLGHMDLPVDQKFDIIEVRFKNGRKEFYRNIHKLDLCTGEAVIVEATMGYHLGHVSLQGELVRLQMLKKKVSEEDESILSLMRLATEKDLNKFKEYQSRNVSTMFRTRQIIEEQGLDMKLSDVEYQGDGTKATFYYSADTRVDFRELIKILAAEFKIRVEMRQISLRQEAARLGGIGVCGRELCCSTWLSEFKNVATSAARYQNLSLNPAKLSGQCGRLKCCLNYELETYHKVLQDIPAIHRPIQTKKGSLFLKKTDIFRKIMWFGYENDHEWHAIAVDKVKELIELNSKGVLPDSIEKMEQGKIAAASMYDIDNEEEVLALERKDKEEKSAEESEKKASKNNQQRKGNHKKGKPSFNKNNTSQVVSSKQPSNTIQKDNQQNKENNQEQTPKKPKKKFKNFRKKP